MVTSAVADLFGRQYFAGNYGAVDFAPAIGSFVLATWVTGGNYDSHTPAGQGICFGRDCFFASYIVAAIACLVGGLPLSIVLWRRTRIGLGQQRATLTNRRGLMGIVSRDQTRNL